jgi:hypothetical protein
MLFAGLALVPPPVVDELGYVFFADAAFVSLLMPKADQLAPLSIAVGSETAHDRFACHFLKRLCSRSAASRNAAITSASSLIVLACVPMRSFNIVAESSRR